MSSDLVWERGEYIEIGVLHYRIDDEVESRDSSGRMFTEWFCTCLNGGNDLYATDDYLQENACRLFEEEIFKYRMEE